MFEIHELNEINSEIDLIFLNNIAKESALIGNEILIRNYNKIQTITSKGCLLYTSPSPRDGLLSRMPSSA